MMVTLSVDIEGQEGLTWPRWTRLVDEVERLGFAGLYRSDHLIGISGPPQASLELIASLTYLASHSQRLRFGSLVAPLSFRDPVMLARQAATIDDLSGGRMTLGVGAGWLEHEHQMFGYHLGDIRTRMDRFEEGLEVITRLLRSDEPITVEGRFFQLREAILLPRPARPGGPRLLIGGNGPQRTLPLVARHADVWNAQWLTPEDFRERSARLDDLARRAGRQPGDIRRTVMVMIFCGRNEDEIARRARYMRRFVPGGTELSAREFLAALSARTRSTAIIGSPEQAVERVKAYKAAGVEEIMVQWFDLEDDEGLRTLSEDVLANVQ